MKTKIFENVQYLVLVGLIVAQCVIGKWYLIGQTIYLFCNVTSVIRDYVLKRPTADKVKDYACTAITIGLILIALKWGEKMDRMFVVSTRDGKIVGMFHNSTLARKLIKIVQKNYTSELYIYVIHTDIKGWVKSTFHLTTILFIL